jgi:hypothetical protein
MLRALITDLPPPPDTLVVGEFTVHLRQGLNRAWLAKIADRDGPRIMVRAQGRDIAVRRAREWCERAMKRPEEMPLKRRPRGKAPASETPRTTSELMSKRKGRPEPP